MAGIFPLLFQRFVKITKDTVAATSYGLEVGKLRVGEGLAIRSDLNPFQRFIMIRNAAVCEPKFTCQAVRTEVADSLGAQV